jgi:hypothetical protein
MVFTALVGSMLAVGSAKGTTASTAAAALNVQLYPCNTSAPWGSRQKWVPKAVDDTAGAGLSPSFTLTLAARPSDGTLMLQDPAPTTATTCSGSTTCLNVVVGTCNAAADLGDADSNTAQVALAFQANGSKLSVLQPDGTSLCLAADWTNSHNYLPNVFLTECDQSSEATGWALQPGGGALTSTKPGRDTDTADASATQCLDVGSGGSAGDLGFRLGLQPAPPPTLQAFNKATNSSWGGSVISDDAGTWHMFLSVFADNAGLKSWQSKSEIVHAVADSPGGVFTPQGRVAGPFAHNPQVSTPPHPSWRDAIAA